jgi:rhodanese-related sulfurtransferase
MPVTDVDAESAAHLVSTGQCAYLDVRTPEEFAEGRCPGAINIPFMLKGAEGLTPNENFLDEVKAKFPNPAEDKVAVGCQVGGRSAKAAQLLDQEQYQYLVNVLGGFAAWQKAGLPVENDKCWMGPKNV